MLDDANEALEKSDYVRAISLYSEALKSSPHDALVYQGLAKALYKLGKYEEAERNCESAIQLDPTLPIPYVILSYLKYDRKEDFNTCYQLAERAYELAPNLPETNRCLGGASLLVDNNEQAVTLLEKALSLGLVEWQIYYNLSVACTRLNKADEAFIWGREFYKLRSSPDTGIKLFLLFMNQRKIKNWSSVLLFGTIISAIILRFAGLLIIPAVYDSLLLVFGIYAINQGSKRSGAKTIIGTLLSFLILLVLAIWLKR